MISVEKYPNNTKTSNRRLNKSYHAGSEHTVRSKRSRRSYPGDQRLMPSAGSRRPRPSGIKMIELDLETRTIIRRIAFSTLIAAGKFFLSYVHSKKLDKYFFRCCLPYLCHCKIAPYSRRKKAKCLDWQKWILDRFLLQSIRLLWGWYCIYNRWTYIRITVINYI